MQRNGHSWDAVEQTRVAFAALINELVKTNIPGQSQKYRFEPQDMYLDSDVKVQTVNDMIIYLTSNTDAKRGSCGPPRAGLDHLARSCMLEPTETELFSPLDAMIGVGEARDKSETALYSTGRLPVLGTE